MPTNIPWKIFINEQHRLSGYENQAYYHPLFAYEAIFSIANLAILLWLEKQNKLRFGSGELFTIYILNYAVIRFLLEFFRLDVSLVTGLNINQAAAAAIGTLAGVFVYMRHRQTP
jgi:prolipoprotein diacylglyceryltransferase